MKIYIAPLQGNLPECSWTQQGWKWTAFRWAHSRARGQPL